MTRLFNEPASFTEDMLAGFLDAHADLVLGVPGGVVRATETPPGKVAVVVGGGSGHYPAFCGVVGDGFADAAVVGNIFTSPSTAEIMSVARAASGSGGVLFTFGNYAGDVLNFGLAQQRLRDEGLDVRTVLVTDDIASAGRDEVEKRRGIAGDFVVFKVAGAAAEAGYDLDGVERVARIANDRTRSFGVAFAGCTFPGRSAPLFEVPAGRMGVGLGIHGEPGIAEEPLPTADELGRRLVSALLEELPPSSGRRVAAVLNGLGTTKYEELFVLWRTVSAQLAAAGYEVVAPEVGELVTSLDMAGCSLTLTVLDDELERFWLAAARTPAFSRAGEAGTGRQAGRRRDPRDVAASPETVTGSSEASPESRARATIVLAALESIARAMTENEDGLAQLDSIAGDGDHGRGMVRGSAAALDAAGSAAQRGAGAGTVLQQAGDAWGASAGGTSGVLWGGALAALGSALGDEDDVTADSLAAAVAAAGAAVQQLGKAQVGDKTMVDAIVPFVEELTRAVEGAPLVDAWDRAASAAERAAGETARLSPKLGRARPLAERSVGSPDPGAVSFALVVQAVGPALRSTRNEEERA